MSSELIVPLIMRWVHILSATLAIGVPFFVRFVLTPAANKVLTDEQHRQLREAVNSKWRHVVYLMITLFIITGFYTFMVTARWRGFSPEDKQLYHMLFGIKVLAALGIFFLASALAGRTKTFAPIREKRKLFLSILLLLGLVVVVCAGIMRYLPLHGTPIPAVVAPQTAP